MWNRSIASLLAASAFCLALGACSLEAEDDPSSLIAGGDSGPSPTYSIGGTVAGATGSVALQNSNGTVLILAGDGSFAFDTPMVPSALYNVTVVVQPRFQTCRVTNGAGTVDLADVSDVIVTCTPNTYTAGNTIAARARGLSASDFQ